MNQFYIGRRVRIHDTIGDDDMAHLAGQVGVIKFIDYGREFGIAVDIDPELDVEFWFSESELEPL